MSRYPREETNNVAPADEVMSATETAPGLRVLRQLWNIEVEPKPRDTAPRDVAHDIYSVPRKRSSIPRRVQGRAEPPGS